MKLLIAGGGTGGHVFPALAIAREWMSRGNERDVVLVGTQRGIEMKLVPQAGLPLETLRVAGLKGKGGATLLRNLAMLAPGIADAFRVLRKHKPVAAFGVGGYAAGPMLLATWLSGVPNIIFEPNAEPGFTNRVLARISRRIATGYNISARAWGKKAVVTGCPVRTEFFSIAPRTPQKPFRLLITGGSQGARNLNQAVWGALDALCERFEEVVHLAGRKGAEGIGQHSRAGYTGVAFADDMPALMAVADLVVSRAGVGTIAEVTAVGLPMVLVPGTFGGGHQDENAAAMVEAGAAVQIDDAKLTPESLVSTIDGLTPEGLRAMAKASAAAGRRDAAQRVLAVLHQVAGKK